MLLVFGSSMQECERDTKMSTNMMFWGVFMGLKQDRHFSWSNLGFKYIRGHCALSTVP